MSVMNHHYKKNQVRIVPTSQGWTDPESRGIISIKTQLTAISG